MGILTGFVCHSMASNSYNSISTKIKLAFVPLKRVFPPDCYFPAVSHWQVRNALTIQRAVNQSMSIFAASTGDAKAIAEIVSRSNKDVAVTFGITKENNPKHPSFYDEAWALADFERGEEYFLHKINGENAGCVAFEQPNPEVGYLNRLSVLPPYRKRGIGAELVRHVFHYAQSKKVPEISIGIIAENSDLKDWYKNLGFVENGLKNFPHLPFDVLFMKYVLTKSQR